MRRVLIVDDETLIADTLTLIFKSRGFEVHTAYSAREAILAVEGFNPELVVCDICMPGRSGLELMKDIATGYPRCKVIVLTGGYASLPMVREQCSRMPHGAGLLLKPCHPLDLLREAGAMLAA